MNREIKFRAFLNKEKKMYEDTFAVTESGQMVVVEQDAVHLNPDYIFLDKGEYELLQFTGLKDKNDVEIYEGDIVENDGDDAHEVVTFDEGSFWLEGSTYTTPLYEVNTEAEEVIGNIYENPEILKEDSQ